MIGQKKDLASIPGLGIMKIFGLFLLKNFLLFLRYFFSQAAYCKNEKTIYLFSVLHNLHQEKVMKNILYTIGYHSFSLQAMCKILKDYKIGALIDVRAWPSSVRYPEFDAEKFAPIVNSAGIYHLCMGNGLGVRPENPALYTDGKVDYAKIASGEAFKKDIARICKGLSMFPVCLMCKEEDPAYCHRAILVCRHIATHYPEIIIRHILPSGNFITQNEIDLQLLQKGKKTVNYLLPQLLQKRLDDAYAKRARQIAWKMPDNRNSF